MKLKKSLLFISIFLLFSTTLSAKAFSNCQLKYDSDKRALPEFKGMCNVCHISPNGAGPQNEFGRAFANAGFKITDELVNKFPEFFQKSQTNSSSSGSLETPLQPSIKRIKPKTLKTNVQTMITIFGQNFAAGTKAFVDNNETITTFKSKAKLIADIVLNTTGMHSIKVQNPDGQDSNTVNVMAK